MVEKFTYDKLRNGIWPSVCGTIYSSYLVTTIYTTYTDVKGYKAQKIS